MKKAEDILSEIMDSDDAYNGWYEPDGMIETYSSLVHKAIKATQIDAIDETVRRCAENAEVKWDSMFDGEGSCYFVDKQSILQVAEELKKELE